MAIDPRTQTGVVGLTVRDLDRVLPFYERALGLRVMGRDSSAVRLGPAVGPVLVELVGDPDAPPRPPRTTGLLHLAILVPDRHALAGSLQRMVDARARLQGASDHLVSEALYLSDPEGNGIEVYRDRPRDEWGRADGEIRMATLPLDLQGLLEDAAADDPERGEGSAVRTGRVIEPVLPAATRIGHVHLNVADLDAAEAFYGGVLGLDVTVRSYPGALFMSAGGYHHHVGLNTWRGTGAPPPPPGAAGLRHFELAVPDVAELDRIESRLRDAGIPATRTDNALRTEDPSSNGIVVRVGD